MTPYPQLVPIEAATTVINAVRNGIAETGKPGDLGCVVLACWNVLGYGLSLGIPCSHPVGLSSADLATLLQPLTGLQANAEATVNIPWEKIIPLVMQLLLALLDKKGA